MEFLPSWEAAKQRHTRWWAGDLERPLVQVLAPRADMKPHQPFDGWGFLRHQDAPERVIEDFERSAAATFYGGEAFPNLFLNLGPGVLAAYLSGYLEFSDAGSTAWFERPQSWEALGDLRLHGNKWQRFTRHIAELAAEAGQDRFFVGATDIGGILDVIASLRGTQDLLCDLITDRARVHAIRPRIVDAWHAAFDEIDAILRAKQEGTSAWMGLWAPGSHYPLQSDFAAMISPEDFEVFVAPDVQDQCRRLDYSIYHLDGPGQLPHVDALLGIPELDGIQWVPGAGNPQCESPDWLSLYERILDAGKLLVLQPFDRVDTIPEMLDSLPGRGKNAAVSAWLPSEDAARGFLQRIEMVRAAR